MHRNNVDLQPNPRTFSSRLGLDMPVSGNHTLLSVDAAKPERVALSPDMQWFEKAIGQFVQSGIYLLAGQPGSRKSGLALQIGLDLAKQGQRCLFILNEEPASRLKERAIQLTSNWASNDVRRALSNLHTESNLYDLESLPTFISQQVLSPSGAHHGVNMIVIDSIQGNGLPSGATGKYRKLYEAMRLCQSTGITTLLIGHVTKRDQVCGPRDLEHNVDVILLLRRAMSYRPLFVPKNRFGAAVFNPVPLEMEPRTTRLRVSPHVRLSTGVAKTYLGSSVGLAEVQASVSLPAFGSRGKIMSSGLPRHEIEQLVACISQVPGLEVDGLDYVIHCRLPEDKAYRTAMGLPLCLSLLGSYLQRPVPSIQLAIGEVDLCRNLRDLPPSLIDELAASISAGDLGRKARLPMTCALSLAQHRHKLANN